MCRGVTEVELASTDVSPGAQLLVFVLQPGRCWVRMPTGCNDDLSETSENEAAAPTDDTGWFEDTNCYAQPNCDAALCEERSAAYNNHCSRTDHMWMWLPGVTAEVAIVAASLSTSHSRQDDGAEAWSTACRFASWPRAHAMCAAVGARLCSSVEVGDQSEVESSGCWFDSLSQSWTNDECEGGHFVNSAKAEFPALCVADGAEYPVRCCADSAGSLPGGSYRSCDELQTRDGWADALESGSSSVCASSDTISAGMMLDAYACIDGDFISSSYGAQNLCHTDSAAVGQQAWLQLDLSTTATISHLIM